MLLNHEHTRRTSRGFVSHKIHEIHRSALASLVLGLHRGVLSHADYADYADCALASLVLAIRVKTLGFAV